MTYSIVAKDKKTWNLWVAVQTHWFWVGNNVPWLEAWVWAIATQAQTEMRYGKEWLQLLQQWLSSEETLKRLLDEDEFSETRQVAIMDTFWNIAAHTGESCISYAWYLKGDGFIVQGNILTNEDVLWAMYESYNHNSNLDFADRLVASIRAGEEAGGELRGVQSAAIRIVSWEKNQYDILNLKVDDSENPLNEIERQLKIATAYDFLNKAEELGQTWSVEESKEFFEKALKSLPNNKEIPFWEAYMLKTRWKEKEAIEILDKYFKDETMWQILWERINSTH